MQATLTSKGQLTLPAAIRHKLKLLPGDKLDCVALANGRIEMIPARGSIRDLCGSLPRRKRPVSVENMERAIHGSAVRKVAKRSNRTNLP